MIDYKLIKTDNPVDGLKNLYEVVKCLRDPKDGCPWDLKQTPKDTVRDLQGEIYEYMDALYKNDKENMKEELGDVYMALFLLGIIHEQEKDFELADCLNEACEKYIRRHPHVFTDTIKCNSEQEVLTNWTYIKNNVEGRKKDENSFFSKNTKILPEIERCYEISKEAAKVGFEFNSFEDVINKVKEELRETVEADTEENLQSELGDLLFSVINVCRFKKIKPQDALEQANLKFINRFENLYSSVKKDKLKLEDLSNDQWNEYWEKAKSIYPE